jgi:hypothetical protein
MFESENLSGGLRLECLYVVRTNAGHSSRSVWGMNCLRSLGRWDRGFESHPGHGCFVCVCVYSVFVLPRVSVAALRRADHSSKEYYRLWKMISELNKRPGPSMGWKSHWKKKKRSWDVHVNMGFMEIRHEWYGRYSTGLGQSSNADFYQHDNDSSGSWKSGNLLITW